VAKILEARGISGVTPKEIDEVFSARRITRSENLIYNALSLLRKEGKLEKKNGRYYFVSADSPQTPAAPRKHRISAEGIKRIREANKKRWAEKRAARNGGAKSTSKKSAQRAIGGSAKQKK
jgi:DNA-binding transcriptional regulator YhcF (GntR family)